MQESRTITIHYKWKLVKIEIDKIIYVLMKRQDAEIHVYGDKTYVTRITCVELKKQLGESFIEIRRGCIVSAMAIRSVTKKVNLINGESLRYTERRRKEIRTGLYQKQQDIIRSFGDDDTPKTPEEYRQHYICYENAPFAFADIEMVFDEESHALDWIFRYGNEALAKLEMFPLERLIGSTFGSLFENMDSKWLRFYEKAVLYGEVMEINDYSPEIDADLKVICFPTFRGHCGCILFNADEIKLHGKGCDEEELQSSEEEKSLKPDTN
ncbi:MAG: LytTR family transcriptional regulator DNA-binding domain-containing protein [Oscillospiraceae bacterium]|nr:LytTR family transcriptional regulator DNA-binding domain-containing protein [Oscillospiraceae bacterium]